MNPITIPNITIPTIGLPAIGISSVGFPSASGGGLIWPKGLKESIKAIYDPAKQGMTNYDVIESYAEDFTNWINASEKYTGSLTSNSLILTNISQATALIYSSTKPYDFKVLITGLQEGQHIKFGFDYGETILEADKDGVYTIEWKDGLKGYGIYTNFVGECNITITQLPTSILKDLSGNGNHAYLYGGKGKLNSGMGVYQQDFSKLIISRVDKKQDPFGFTVSGSGGTYLAYMQLGNWNNKAFKILANINAKGDYLYLRFRNSTDAVITSVMLKNGENIIPAQNIEGATKAVFEYSLKEGESITITQIPDYPDQLCYDGKMYAVCYDFPILTDYTVMAERTWFKDKLTYWGYFISKRNVFECERISVTKEETTNNFGLNNNVTIVDDRITYQNKSFYNNQIIRKGNNIDNGSPLLISGTPRSFGTENFIGCHGKIIVADRSFTEDEITWLKDNWKKI